MEKFLVVLSVSFALFALVAIVLRRTRQLIEQRKRKRLETEIVSIAGDTSTNPDGLSLRDVVDLLEISMIEEILHEIRQMPAGSRKLQTAIEITGREDYRQK